MSDHYGPWLLFDSEDESLIPERDSENNYHVRGRQQACKLYNLYVRKLKDILIYYSNFKSLKRMDWRECVVPAALVIPAPIVYILVVVLKTFVIGGC